MVSLLKVSFINIICSLISVTLNSYWFVLALISFIFNKHMPNLIFLTKSTLHSGLVHFSMIETLRFYYNIDNSSWLPSHSYSFGISLPLHCSLQIEIPSIVVLEFLSSYFSDWYFIYYIRKMPSAHISLVCYPYQPLLHHYGITHNPRTNSPSTHHINIPNLSKPIYDHA